MQALGVRIEVIDEDMAATLRLKTGAERIAIASHMFGSARRMLLNHLRTVHSDWDQRQVKREAARRLWHALEPEAR
jgi:Rv0078B-related antitoxin